MRTERVIAAVGSGLFVAGLCAALVSITPTGAEALYKTSDAIGIPWVTPLLVSTLVPGFGAALLAWSVPVIYRRCDQARRASPQP